MAETTLMILEGENRLLRADEHLGVTYHPVEGLVRQYRKRGFLSDAEKKRIKERFLGTDLDIFADKIRHWNYATTILARDVRAGDEVISSGMVDKSGDYRPHSLHADPQTVEAISFIDEEALSELEAGIRSNFEITRNNAYWNQVAETMKGLERNTDSELFPGMPDEAKQLIQREILSYLNGQDVPEEPVNPRLDPRIYESVRRSIGDQVDADRSQTYDRLSGAIEALCEEHNELLTADELKAKLLVEPPVSGVRRLDEIDAIMDGE